MKSVKHFYVLFLALSSLAAGEALAQSGTSAKISSACQVEPLTDQASEPSPGSGFSFSFGGAGVGGGRHRSPTYDSGSDGESAYRGTRDSHSNVGVGLTFNLGDLFRRLAKPEIPQQLFEEGPQFEAAFSLACIPVRAFVRGGWPLVIDYQAEPGTIASVEIHVDGREPFVLPLRGGSQHNVLKVKLPDQLGDQLSPALFLVRGIKDQPGAPVLGRINVFGLGAGPRAVGSVAIDQVEFEPGTMSLGKKETARFSFYSRSDFNRAAAEVLRVMNRDGDLQVQLARSIPLSGGVAAGTWVGRDRPLTWDGTNASRQPSLGQHLMQVRAWLSAQEGGDWVAAWSAWTVEVTR